MALSGYERRWRFVTSRHECLLRTCRRIKYSLDNKMINYFQVGVASVATDTNWFVDDEFCLIIKVGFN